MLVSHCLGSRRSAWWAPVLCHGDVQKGKQVQQRWGIKIKPCKRQSEYEKVTGLYFLASYLKIRTAHCKARDTHTMLLISKVQAGGTNGMGDSRPLTQRGSCHGEELVLTCALEPTPARDCSSCWQDLSLFSWVKKHCIRSRLNDHAQEAVIISSATGCPS